MSVLHPDNLERYSFVIRVVKPDIMLVQSKKSESFFNNMGVKTQFIPNAVDTKKFSPAKPEQKTTIRNMWGIPKENFVILHVGHIIKARNLEVLIELKKIHGVQVIIIASNFFQHDQKISDLLLEAGCKIIRGYIPNIEDAYKLADCYIFPVSIDKSILTPLSVMEAMACNLPVITTKFEGLLELFPEGNGLFYIDDDGNYYRVVENIITKKNCTYTRDMVLPYTWKKISEMIEKIYFDLVDEK
jgi:glycosyltransferase involved in cell wall biosynthesis